MLSINNHIIYLVFNNLVCFHANIAAIRLRRTNVKNAPFRYYLPRGIITL